MMLDEVRIVLRAEHLEALMTIGQLKTRIVNAVIMVKKDYC